MAEEETKRGKGERPHAVLIPLPVLGHITPLLQLAQVLMDRDVFVTFLNTEVNHKLLNPVSTSQIRFLSFPDGLPPEHPRVHKLDEFWNSVINVCPPHIHAIMQHSIANNSPNDYDAATPPPVTAIVFDGCIYPAKAIARQYGVAAIMFVTHNACSLSAFLSINSLIQHGLISIPRDEERQRELMEKEVTFLPGLEWLRVKDLPSFLNDISDGTLALIRRGYGDGTGVDLVVINTWQELQVEGTVVAHLNSGETYAGKLVPVGPLIEWTGGRTPVSRSLWTEDDRCIAWLDKHRARSVVYVSFGSITLMRREQAAELAWGLLHSGCSFLWVLRPDFFIHDEQEQEHEHEHEHGLEAVLAALELADKTAGAAAGKGLVVEWAPQWAVLRHPAVGGFVTHCGWNSCVESLTAGVPMLCWPYFADQLTNCRMLTHVCKAALPMGHHIERHRVATLVRALMEDQEPPNAADDTDKAGIRRNAESVRESGLRAVSQGGSSSANLGRLLELISRGCRSS